MCVLAFAWVAHPRWRLVLAGNRDELHARPAVPLAHWQNAPHIIAGRDAQAGGTWLGVSEQGRFAVVTNLRGFGLPVAGRISRGELVGDFLGEQGRFADPQAADISALNPFNLITADKRRAWFHSNRPDTQHEELPPGIYGLSNGALDEGWPRTLQLRDAMDQWLREDSGQPEYLLNALRIDQLDGDAAASDDPTKPDNIPVFIQNPVYGTRCSTVVAIDHEGKGVIVECSYSADGFTTGEVEIAFNWPN